MLHGILAALLLSGIQAGAKPHLALSIEVPKNEYVLGEPIVIRQTVENTGNGPGGIAFGLIPESPVLKVVAKGTVRQECMQEWPSVKWKFLAHQTIAAGARIERDVRADWCGITDEGDYEVWVVYDTTSLSSDWASVGVGWETLESKHVKFSIGRAQSDDQAALAKYGDKCNRVGVDSREWSDRLMGEFPDSTYAAAEAPALLKVVRLTLARKPVTSALEWKVGEVILLWRMNKKEEAVSRLKALVSDSDPTVAKQAQRFLEATEILNKQRTDRGEDQR